MLQDELLREARELSASLEEIFIAIHRNPELGNQERATSSLVRRQLELLGIEAVPMAGTGVMGVIRGALPGKCLGFRADMDALPIQEETGLPYASQNPGVMHACGHDFHVAALLGAAELLQRRRETLTGTVKLFFQPDEEGDGGGARMIAEGCMENPRVDAVLCCHVESGIPTGTVSLCEGPVCAASNPFTLTLRGRGPTGLSPTWAAMSSWPEPAGHRPPDHRQPPDFSNGAGGGDHRVLPGGHCLQRSAGGGPSVRYPPHHGPGGQGACEGGFSVHRRRCVRRHGS